MLDATDWSDKDGLILALSNSESPVEIWEKIPARGFKSNEGKQRKTDLGSKDRRGLSSDTRVYSPRS